MLYRRLSREAARSGSRLITQYANGCRPYVENHPSERCDRFFRKGNQTVAELVELRPPRFAVLAGAWNRDIHGVGWKAARGKSDSIGVSSGVRRSIKHLQASGVKKVLVLGPVPEFPAGAPGCLLRVRAFSLAPETCSVARPVVDARRVETVAEMRKATHGLEGVLFLDPIELFCDKKRCRPANAKGETLYIDEHHLSDAAVTMIFRKFKREMKWLLEPQTVD
jgi:hypothetical protein